MVRQTRLSLPQNKTRNNKKIEKNISIVKPKKGKMQCQQNGLGACFGQLIDNNWHPISYASRFLYSNEQEYSTKYFERLTVLSLLEHFKYYLYGTKSKPVNLMGR